MATATGGVTPQPVASARATQGAFATALECARCHGTDAASLRDAAGRDVAPYALWSASMMANASRDPLWRAEVSVEVAATPSAAAVIEAKCMSCHAPMAHRDAQGAVSLALLDQGGSASLLAVDGVSCTVCHQATAPADVRATFDGAFALNGQRELYGPHANPRSMPMLNQLNYLPREAAHMTQSDLCASCHTLTTAALDPSGAPSGGSLLEQSPFLEWQNSVYNDQVAVPHAKAASCQACHVPTDDVGGSAIATPIAASRFGTPARSPFGRHVFVGGNTLIPQILRDQAAALSPQAPAAAFDALIAATRTQLQTRTAQVRLASSSRAGDTLELGVEVQNASGHKFPTGHPTRRAWLRLTVTDAQGRVVFASGAHDAQGRIVAGGTPLPSELAGGPHQPHHATISASDQVQIYQALMRDGAGDLTFLLLRGEGYLKDNRLLPEGWSSTHPTAAVAGPAGLGADPDFGAGGEVARYRVNAPASAGPYAVEATLLYQSLSPRFAAELFQYSTPEVAAFQTYYAAADRTPERVAQVRAQVN
ncbi:MAG: multiheme c-type cytochrome [Planctomycetota bacterium]